MIKIYARWAKESRREVARRASRSLRIASMIVGRSLECGSEEEETELSFTNWIFSGGIMEEREREAKALSRAWVDRSKVLQKDM